MNEQEYLEIRLHLLGSSGVGKKSILSKFESLSSSKNVISNEKELKINNGHHHKHSHEKDSENEHSSSVLNKTPLALNNTNNHKLKKKTEHKTIIKQYKILQYLIGFKGYVIPEANQVDPDYDPFQEEDEDDHIDIIKKYNISFKKTKLMLSHYINSEITNLDTPSSASIQQFMLFVFDLSDYSTFEHLMVYYKALSKQFQLNTHPYKIVIGNKVEKKIPFTAANQEVIANFLKETSMKMYEISTKTFYPFSKFFEQLFNNHFQSYRTEFSTNPFKEKLSLILFSKPSFPKAQRKTFVNTNDYPGPFNYENNIYEYGSKQVFDDIMSNKRKKYNTKIFINKIGPIFNKAVVSFLPNPPKETDEEKKMYKINFNNNNRIKENQCGYSLGLKSGILNLKSVRQEKLKALHQELQRSFDSNSSSLYLINDKKVNSDTYFQLIKERKNDYIKRLIHDRSAKNVQIQKLHQKNIKKLKQNQSEKDISVGSLEIGEKVNRYSKRKISPFKNPSRILVQRQSFITPGPDAYDTRGNALNTKKGISITGKRQVYQSPVLSLPFNNIQSDFDIIIKEAKRIKINHFSERFPSPTPIQPTGSLININNRLDRWVKNKDKSKRSQLLKSFLEKRMIRKIDHDYLINEIELNKDEAKHDIFEKLSLREKDNEKPKPINYNLVYERSPSVSII